MYQVVALRLGEFHLHAAETLVASVDRCAELRTFLLQRFLLCSTVNGRGHSLLPEAYLLECDFEYHLLRSVEILLSLSDGN